MILVGVDGSRTGLEAAAWAGAEAALRRTPLTVAHVVARWVCEDESSRYAEVGRWLREGGATVLAAAEERVRRENPYVEVRTELLPGDPRAALIEAAADAELLVVGSRGIGGIRGLLVGSVAHGVAAHARTDVVLVPARPAGAAGARGEIVAGVDGSPDGLRALDFALAEAGRRGVPLRAVHGWAWPQVTGFGPADPDSEQDVLRELRTLVAERRERHPGVAVVTEVVHGHPVEVLKEAAAGADLLVVGSRGHTYFAGLVLGSVSQALLHHAPCPLAVVRR
ncbi:Universal stress protein [Nonomuraea coxensis DSM 45129]|uniref:Universal stress protein n=1 Tax=Nonomuraea coxensis DSM 45129 TaxID=1122611 RepID=A0ABX8TX13_9ACTN|nr:universal stress protein [Nonomuraea coxensis]QYC39059.1 Universal stress protein [Nonomuraea coxensis DSM 45129]